MSETKNQETKKPRRKMRKGIKTKIISIVFIIAAITIFTNVGKQVYQMLQLKKKAELVAIELKNLQDENASLLTIKTKLEDPNYVTTYARGEYMFSKGDEQLFYLPSNSKDVEEDVKEETKEEQKQDDEQQEEQKTDEENKEANEETQ